MSLCVPRGEGNSNLPVLAAPGVTPSRFDVREVGPFVVCLWTKGCAEQLGFRTVLETAQKGASGECRESIKRVNIGLRWEYTDIAGGRNEIELSEAELAAGQAKPMQFEGEANVSISLLSAPTSESSDIHLTPAGRRRITEEVFPGESEDAAVFSFPVVSSDDYAVIDFACVSQHIPLLINVSEVSVKGARFFSLCNGKWEGGVTKGAEVSVKVKTVVAMKKSYEALRSPNSVTVVSGRIPPERPGDRHGVYTVSLAVPTGTTLPLHIQQKQQRGSVKGVSSFPYWNETFVEVPDAFSFEVYKDGLLLVTIPGPSYGLSEGWLSASKGGSEWPEFELFCRWNLPSKESKKAKRPESRGAPATSTTSSPYEKFSPRKTPQKKTTIVVKGIRVRKLKDASGDRPQAVTCGLICDSQTQMLGSTLPNEAGVWVWTLPKPPSLELNSVTDTFGITILEDIEGGAPIGTVFLSLSDTQVGLAKKGDLRISVDLLNGDKVEAGDCEIAVSIPTPMGKKKPSVRRQSTQQPKKVKGSLLISLAQFTSEKKTTNTGFTAKIKVGTRTPETKECKIGGSVGFDLARLRDLVNIRVSETDGTIDRSRAVGGQISFLIEPNIGEGVFKTTHREGWLPLQQDAGPYFDKLTSQPQCGTLFVRYTVDVRDGTYNDLPSGRDFENHAVFTALTVEEKTTRSSRNNAPIISRSGGAAVKREKSGISCFFLKVKGIEVASDGANVVRREGDFIVRAKFLPAGKVTHEVPLNTKVKLKSNQNPRELQLSVYLKQFQKRDDFAAYEDDPFAQFQSQSTNGPTEELLGDAVIELFSQGHNTPLSIPIQKYGITTGSLALRWEREEGAPPPPPPMRAGKSGGAHSAMPAVARQGGAAVGPHHHQDFSASRQAKEALLNRKREEVANAKKEMEALRAQHRGSSVPRQQPQQQHNNGSPKRTHSPKRVQSPPPQHQFVEKQNRKLSTDLRTLQSEYSTAATQNEILTERVRQMEAMNATLQTRQHQPQPQPTQKYLEEEVDRLAAELDAERRERQTITSTNGVLEERLKRTHEAHSLELSDLKQHRPNSSPDAELATLKGENEALRRELRRVTSTAESAVSPTTFRSAKHDKNALLAELATLQTMHNEATKRLQEEERMHSNVDSREDQTELITSLRAQNARTEQECDVQERRLVQCEAELRDTQRRLVESQATEATLRRQMGNMKSDIEKSCRLFKTAMHRIAELERN